MPSQAVMPSPSFYNNAFLGMQQMAYQGASESASNAQQQAYNAGSQDTQNPNARYWARLQQLIVSTHFNECGQLAEALRERAWVAQQMSGRTSSRSTVPHRRGQVARMWKVVPKPLP
jgi:hypothetical protein